METDLRFRVLGPLEVWDGGWRAVIVGRQQRALLAALLLNANRVVSVDRLIESLWDAHPPVTARRLLHGCVAALRRALRTGDGRVVRQPLLTRLPGYLLEVRPQELDLDDFADLVATAGRVARQPGIAGLEGASRLLSEGLALWRGPLLDGIALHGFAGEIAALEERRLAALEERIDIDLRLGRHSALIGELQAGVADYPLRERLWAQLILALAGTDRQADALAAYHQVRAVLIDQLGLEPGALLRTVHQVILSGGDPLESYLLIRGTHACPGEAVPGEAVLAEAVPAERQPPAQLPPDVDGFTGREGELATLDAILTRAGEQTTALRVAAVTGAAGVGKTALAVHWAHRVAGRFPDGQLYLDLRGYADGPSVSPIDALTGFLRALGLPGHRIPLDLEQAAGTYRTMLAGKRMLVVLDNGSADGVRPLLPGTPSCVVVVTSRDTLSALVARHGAHRLELDRLALADSVALLQRLIGRRAEDEPGAIGLLAVQCVQLPLALRFAAELIGARPGAPLAELVKELTDRQRRLELLDAGEHQIGRVFSWSYRRLPPEAARAFRLLGLHPGPDHDSHAVAALCGTDLAEARRLADRLGRAHLLHPTGAHRSGMHDLLRAYARQLTQAEDAEEDRLAALTRLFDHYRGAAKAALASLRADQAADISRTVHQVCMWMGALSTARPR